ncbi:MAG: histidinol dehydrogenase [Acholeplasmatales bacterium]|nr:histidinol dehydrogenase [Acholeplasmatales bacterium]
MKIYNNKEELLNKLDSRGNSDNSKYLEIVKDIIKNIRLRGDEALIEYTNKFDSPLINLNNIKVTEEEILNGYNSISEELKATYKKAKERITKFHEHQKESTWMYEEDGEILGQKITPLEYVGLYVPGGKAAYPSTVFMDAIPAIVAGVKNIIMCTPCNKEGKVTNEVLAAAYILGIKDIYKCGGAQAIASMGLGTNTIPKVDKIVGPGNIFVALAKKELFGSISIDSVAGPSEILVIADEFANPKFVAADLLSQAEHDEIASSVLLTNSKELADKVVVQIEEFTNKLERKEIIKKSLDNYGGIIVTKTIDEAIEISNYIAPEHLELVVDKPFNYLDKIVNAGAIFLGNYAAESLGDYMAGPNHVLPTIHTARFFSPLSVYDFIKRSSIISFNKEAFNRIGEAVSSFAKSEGLTAHALAADVRLEEK